MKLQDVLHAIIDLLTWSSADNKDEAHEAVDSHFGDSQPAEAPEAHQPENSDEPGPAAAEGNPS